ncbi:14995_t:CDS:2, partial [Funneliformis geosporum]
KKLNNFISSRDKYRNLLKATFCEINSNETNIRILDPIASDTETRWNSAFFLLEQLIYFHNTLSALADKLVLDSDRSTRIDDATNLTSASLSRRWDIPDELGCIASFLDPRFKFLYFLSEEQIESTKQSLKTRIELLETPASILTTLHLN